MRHTSGRQLGYANASDGRMLRNQLRSLEKETIELHNALLDSDSLPQWVIKKVNVALHDVTTARQYITAKLAGYETNPKAKDVAKKALSGSKAALKKAGELIKKGAKKGAKLAKKGAKYAKSAGRVAKAKLKVTAVDVKIAETKRRISALKKCADRVEVSYTQLEGTKAMRGLRKALEKSKESRDFLQDQYLKVKKEEAARFSEERPIQEEIIVGNPQVPDVWGISRGGFGRYSAVAPGSYDKLPLPKRKDESLYYEAKSRQGGISNLTVTKKGTTYMLFTDREVRHVKNAAEARKHIEKFLKMGSLGRRQSKSGRGAWEQYDPMTKYRPNRKTNPDALKLEYQWYTIKRKVEDGRYYLSPKYSIPNTRFASSQRNYGPFSQAQAKSEGKKYAKEIHDQQLKQMGYKNPRANRRKNPMKKGKVSKALSDRIKLANQYIAVAMKHDIWGVSSFGSTLEDEIKFTHLIKLSPAGNSALVKYTNVNAFGDGRISESFNMNKKDPYDDGGVSDFRRLMTQIINAIKRGAKEEGYVLSQKNNRVHVLPIGRNPRRAVGHKMARKSLSLTRPNEHGFAPKRRRR